MKTLHLIRRAAAVLALALPLSAGAQMVPANDRVRVEVRVDTTSDHKELAKTTADTVTQHKTLNISLSGKAKSPETRVIKWTAYGRNMKSKDLTTLETGEIKLGFGPNGQQAAESKRVSTTYTPEHSVISKSSGRGRGSSGGGRSTPRATKVAASGTKYVGYSVQVLDGGKVVGESSDPSGIGAKK